LCERKSKRALKEKNKQLMEEISFKQQLAEDLSRESVPGFFSQAELPEGESLKSIIQTAEMTILSKEDFVPKAERGFESESPAEIPHQILSQVESASNSEFDELVARANKGLKHLIEKQSEVDIKMDQNDTELEHISKLNTCVRRFNLRRASVRDNSYGLPLSKALEFSVAAAPQEFSKRFCWEVPRFSEHKQQALASPNRPLVSPPWFCQRGYCLRLYLFLNGYGRSKGSYVSIFTSIVRGPYDNFLRWPAIGNISFFFLDQQRKNRNLWCRTRYLDPDAFPQPTKKIDAISAAGVFDFMKLSSLDQYVKDNTLSLAAYFHPRETTK
jgi:hypothetical protein